MAKHISVNRFSRLLQELNTPVYVLDENQAIVYFNDALVQWANVDADALIGQVCRYHVSASRLHHEIIAAALAPPPEFGPGTRVETVLAVDAVREIRYRRSLFLPLAFEHGVFGSLVLVDANDIPPELMSGIAGTSNEVPNDTPNTIAQGTLGIFVSENPTVETLATRELHRLLFAVRRHQAGRYRFETLIGRTPAMQMVRQQAMLAADSVAPVLIVGPPGSGRETLGNAIHFGHDGERSGGLIPVDCHALPVELIDSTIRAFYRRYAKSEHQKRHTLLLNNADLLMPEQAELVVSMMANNPGNMRIIGISPFEPAEWHNHPELPYRLATIKINLPPLFERRDDLPLLAQWFLEQQNTRNATRTAKNTAANEGRISESETLTAQRSGFASDAIDLMTQYHWPGNLDELAEVVQESHAKAKGTLVRAGDLPARLQHTADALAETQSEERIDLEQYLQSVELELITRAIKAAQGNKAKAARLLGMTRPRLYRRLEQLGLIETPVREHHADQSKEKKADLPDFREIASESD